MTLLAGALLLVLTGATAPAQWQLPPGASHQLVDGQLAFKLVATQPHHTRLVLANSAATPDFVARCRFRRLGHTGEPPVIYAYGRSRDGVFRLASVAGSTLRAALWQGAGQPSPQLGQTTVAGEPDGWINLAVASWREWWLVKAWGEGQPEPVWQLAGRLGGPASGEFAVGVWTSPRTPSTAEVLFADLRFEALTEADLPGLGLRVTDRRPWRSVAPPRTEVVQRDGWWLVGNPRLLAALEPETGELAHLIDPTGRDWIDPQALDPLFDLTLTRPDGTTLQLTSRQARNLTWTATPTGLTGRFAGLGGLDLAVTATLTTDSERLRFSLTIAPPDGWAVTAVGYPLWTMPAALGGDPAADTLVLPWADGALLPRPGERTQSRSALYPGTSSFQFSARYDDRGGLYWATDDPAGHVKRWDLRTTAGQGVALPLRHLRPELPGQAETLPYEVLLTTFAGDWRAAAEIYRTWAQRQPWCATKLSARRDIPEFLTSGAGVLITGIQNQQGFNPARYGAELERLPDEIAEYRRRSGLKHVIFVPYGWENRGTWAGVNYLPAQPSNEIWQAVNERLTAQGDRLAWLTSGYWWVVRRQANSNGPAFDDTAQMERQRGLLVLRRDGQPWAHDNYDQPHTGQSWRGYSVKLCHGSPAAQRLMVDLFVSLARLGVPLLSFDQELGGGQNEPCYAPDHGHPPGWGAWMWTDFAAVCRRILAEGKPLCPELGLFLENTSELAIPYMATYWARQFAEIDYGAAGARGVGLFSYLYHDYITSIGAACVQGQGAGRPPAELRVKALANNVTRGQIPGPFLTDVPLTPTSPWHALVSRAWFNYSRVYAPFARYLLLGRCVPPPPVTGEKVDVGYFVESGVEEQGRPRLARRELWVEAVGAGSFQADDGSVVTVLVNCTDQPREVTVSLSGPSRLLTAAGALLETAPPGPALVTVPPLEVRVVAH